MDHAKAEITTTNATGHCIRTGHQRTPAMIEALLKDAKAALNVTSSTCHVPRGGFADVGLHTGGKRRDTAWPLTHAVLQVRRGTFLHVDRGACLTLI